MAEVTVHSLLDMFYTADQTSQFLQMSYSEVHGNLAHVQSCEVILKSEGLSMKGSVAAYPVSSVTKKDSVALQVADFHSTVHRTSGISGCSWPSTMNKIQLHTDLCLNEVLLNRVEAQCH